MPTVTVNRYGKGKAYYQAARDTGSLSDAIITEIINELKIKSALGSRANLGFGVSAHERYDGKVKYVFTENYSDVPVTISLGRTMRDMINDFDTDTVTLAPYGLGIFKYEE